MGVLADNTFRFFVNWNQVPKQFKKVLVWRNWDSECSKMNFDRSDDTRLVQRKHNFSRQVSKLNRRGERGGVELTLSNKSRFLFKNSIFSYTPPPTIYAVFRLYTLNTFSARLTERLVDTIVFRVHVF